MRSLLVVCLLLAMASAARGAGPSLPRFECDRSPLLLRGVDVWTPEGISRKRDVLVMDGVIEFIGKGGKTRGEKEWRVIEGKGQLLLPGFVDAHAHFVFPGSMGERPNADPVADALAFGRQMLASGVTRARVHLDTLEHAKLLTDLASDPCAPMPQLQAGGPAFIPGAGNNENAPVWDVTSVDDAIAKVRREHDLGFQWIAIHDAHKFADDTRGAIVNTARQLGMRILSSGYTQAEVASSLALQPDTVDYLDVSATPEYAPGLLEPARTQPRLTWVVRVGIHERFRALQDDPALIDAPRNYEFMDAAEANTLRAGVHKTIADRGSEHSKRMDGAYPTIRRKFEQLRALGIPLAMGTDVGSPGHFHRDAIWWEIDTWVKYGATLDQALTAATLGGARVMGDREVDGIHAGSRADLLLCPQPLTVNRSRFPDCRVIRGGVLITDAK